MIPPRELKEKVNGKDYTIDHKARKCKILDKYARPRESAYELWLELLNHAQFDTPCRFLRCARVAVIPFACSCRGCEVKDLLVVQPHQAQTGRPGH